MQTNRTGKPANNINKVVLALTSFSALIIAVLLAMPGTNDVTTGKTEPPAILRIGVLPDQSPEVLRKRFDPVLDYLSNTLQLSCELIVPESYEEMLKLFHDQKIDLAYFGGYSFIKAQQNDNAVALVMRLIDTRFTSLFIVNANSPIQTLENMKGKSIAFGSRLSTSGHLMPRYFLQRRNINPESFFSSIQYSGSHDKTVFLVRDGIVDVGAANATTIRSMLDNNRVTSKDIRILWETPPYADYVWATHPKFIESFNTQIREAFLQLSPENPEHATVLQHLNAIGYIPADTEYFASLATIARDSENLLNKNNLN